MRTLHLFAGAGGGLLAGIILGHTPIGAVEFDSYCCRVLRDRAAEGWFPHLRVHEGDVRLFDPSEYAGRVDCVNAGFPCQPHSVAGQRKGEADERNLWPDTRRIIGQLRPRFALLENVPGIVSNGYAAVVVGELSAMGYDCRWAIISAADASAPHRRERWWCLAYLADTGGGRCGEQSTRKIQFSRGAETISAGNDSDTNSTRKLQSKECKQNKRRWIGDVCEGVADADCITRHEGRPSNASQGPRGRHVDRGGERAGIPNANGERLSHGRQTREPQGAHETKGKLALAEPERRGVTWWQAEPDLGRVVDGMASRVDRLKALGNGQVSIQAALAWKILGGP